VQHRANFIPRDAPRSPSRRWQVIRELVEAVQQAIPDPSSKPHGVVSYVRHLFSPDSFWGCVDGAT
jgi:hypothetical protein